MRDPISKYKVESHWGRHMISTSGLHMWHIPACTHAHTYANMYIHCRQTQHRKWKFMKGSRKSGGDVLDNRLEANCIWVHCVWESTVTQLISFFFPLVRSFCQQNSPVPQSNTHSWLLQQEPSHLSEILTKASFVWKMWDRSRGLSRTKSH